MQKKLHYLFSNSKKAFFFTFHSICDDISYLPSISFLVNLSSFAIDLQPRRLPAAHKCCTDTTTINYTSDELTTATTTIKNIVGLLL